MAPEQGSGQRLSGCRGRAAPSCSLQTQARSPFLEGKDRITKGKRTRRVWNSIWIKGSKIIKTARVARKSASETVPQAEVGRAAQGTGPSEPRLRTQGGSRGPASASRPPSDASGWGGQPWLQEAPTGVSGRPSDPDSEPQRRLHPNAQGGPCGLLPNSAEASHSLPVNARVWFRPHAADTITSWLRPSMSLGASTLLVSPCPSCPFSFRPADQEQDTVGRERAARTASRERPTRLGPPRGCPPPLTAENQRQKALAPVSGQPLEVGLSGAG